MQIPLLRELTLHGAARYTDNSLNGGFWSYTGGGNWSPLRLTCGATIPARSVRPR